MSEWGKEEVYMSLEFNYTHNSFAKTLEAVPIYKCSNGRTLLIGKELLRKIWSEPPGSVTLHILEPHFEINCILHDYLSERKGLGNVIIIIPQKLLINNGGTVLKYESMLEFFEECQGIQIKELFEGDEKFIPAGFGGNKEKEIM
jgi:hypothetical protein